MRMKKGAIDFKQLTLVASLECFIHIYIYIRDNEIKTFQAKL